MRRIFASTCGVLLLVAGGLLAPPRRASPGDVSLIGALGRSAGGLRVVASDLLFLRAEQLRREGRIEDLPGLYASIMRLEPTNPAAVEFLAGVQAYDLVNAARDTEMRLHWWESAWDLTADGRRRFPDDPSLILRQADLLLDVPTRHPDLADALEARFEDRTLRGLELLLETARRTDALPRRGRHHLVMLSEAVPVIAATRGGAGQEAVFEIGETLLAIRGNLLGEMFWVGSVDGETIVSVPRSRYLQAGMRAAGAFHEALALDDVERARQIADEFERMAPTSALAEVLRGLLEPR